MIQDCLFCHLAERGEKVFENEKIFVLRDIHPQAPHHYLVIPKKHISSLNELNPSDRRELMPELYAAADLLSIRFLFREQGYRTVINNQMPAGQTVFHLHMHLLSGPALGSKFGAP